MPLTQLLTRAQLALDAPEVRVEIHISNGLPAFTMVGLPETAVREARDRVRSAILNSRFIFPAHRITVNLAPANLPKEGGRYDLPIALGILGASAQVDLSALTNSACFGELALSGACRQIDGLLPALIACKQAGQTAIIPRSNELDASLVRDLPILSTTSLAQLCNKLNSGHANPAPHTEPIVASIDYNVDLEEVYGQYQAKRALEIAAVGGHHMLMVGPPGAGKSMLARRLTTILPPLSESEAMCNASIRSLCQPLPNPATWWQRPFQTPHHTVSGIALVGGGSRPKPGEISLAHHGVLFLDELTEFNRGVIEVLREPLETGQIHISRATAKATFPAQFQLIAAMNPCPGGCDSPKTCDCSAAQLQRYRGKLSAPFLDRIDIQIELGRLEQRELQSHRNLPAENSQTVRRRVEIAHRRQLERQGCLNARLNHRQLLQVCQQDEAIESLLQNAIEKLRLSARSYHKLLMLARSIADLAAQDQISAAHIAEAISYRQLDRRGNSQHSAAWSLSESTGMR